MKALRQKVSERNPDEFAFGMMSSSTKNGVRVAKRGVENGTTGPLSMDMAKLLKTQDAGYLQTVLQQTRRELERVEKEAIMAGVRVESGAKGNGQGKRTSFDENGKEIAVPQSNGSDDSDEEAGEEKAENMSKEAIQARRKQRRAREVLSKHLEALSTREKDLSRALEAVENQRAKMHSTVGGVNKDGTTFKLRERKR